jgi:DNA polymerase-3 subunit delta'
VPFRDIIGHRRLLSLLSRSIVRDALPPSLIFAGPSGVGKRRVAIAVAQALNCLRPVAGGPAPRSRALSARSRVPGPESPAPSLQPLLDLPVDACGECAACRRVARLTHPDVRLVGRLEGRTEILIDQLREVIGLSTYRPFEGRRRVVIIDNADEMAPPAQNALLKSLEEPTASSVFILVTSHADALLPTILSRCPRLRFGPLDVAEIAAFLTREHGHPEAEARAVAIVAGGSLGHAIEVASGPFAGVRATAWEALRQAVEAASAPERLASGRALTEGASSSNLIGHDRDVLAVHLRVLASLVRDLAILSTRAHGEVLANPDLTSELKSLAGSFQHGRAVRAFAAVERALGALERNASPKIVADWLSFQL